MFCPQPHGTYPHFKLIAKKVSATNIFRKKFEKIFSMIRTVTVLRTVPTIAIAHTFCASRDTRISYR